MQHKSILANAGKKILCHHQQLLTTVELKSSASRLKTSFLQDWRKTGKAERRIITGWVRTWAQLGYAVLQGWYQFRETWKHRRDQPSESSAGIREGKNEPLSSCSQLPQDFLNTPSMWGVGSNIWVCSGLRPLNMIYMSIISFSSSSISLQHIFSSQYAEYTSLRGEMRRILPKKEE